MARWCDGWRVLCVNDAYRLLPHSDALYSADWAWWRHHKGAPDFSGERWSCHGTSMSYCDDKSLVAHEFDVNFVEARDGRGFSDGGYIHYGHPQPSSGYQAVNLALVMGAALVVLVGFDGHARNGAHFFGDHPKELRQCPDSGYREFSRAYMPDDRIVNATPSSSIEVYRFVGLEEILRAGSVYRNGAIPRSEADRGSAN